MSYENEINEVNSVMNKFRASVRRAGKANIQRMTGGSSVVRSVQAGPELRKNLSTRARKDYGEIFMVGFVFPRHGVFVHKGVGRGWQMQGGKVVRVAKGEYRGEREPKDWLNSEIEKRLPKLADDIVEIKADAVVNATKVKIN